MTKSQLWEEGFLPSIQPAGTHDPAAPLPSPIAEEEHRANAEFLAGAYTENTGVAYRSQFKAWLEWCTQRDISFVLADSDTLVTYLRERVVGVEIGGRYYKPAKPNSLRVARAAISKAYEVAGLLDITKSPQISEALRSHKNSAARAGVKVRQAEALTVEVLAAIRATALHPRRGRGGVETENHARLRGLVDIALVGLMRDCLLRRSEAAAVKWNHITVDADGSGRLFVGVSKTDQEGAGALLFISRQTMRDLGAIRPLGAGDQLVFGLKPKAIGKRIAAGGYRSRPGRRLQRPQRPRRHGEGPCQGRRRAPRAHDSRTLEERRNGGEVHRSRERRTWRSCEIPQGVLTADTVASFWETFTYSLQRGS